MRNVCVELQVLIRQVNVVQVQFDQLIFIFYIAVRCLQSIDRRAQFYLSPPTQVACKKAMFPVVSVSLSTRRGSHVIGHMGPDMDTWDTPCPSQGLFKLVHFGTPPTGLSIQTCSFGDLSPPWTYSNLFTWGPFTPPLPTYWRADGWPLTERPSCF